LRGVWRGLEPGPEGRRPHSLQIRKSGGLSCPKIIQSGEELLLDFRPVNIGDGRLDAGADGLGVVPVLQTIGHVINPVDRYPRFLKYSSTSSSGRPWVLVI
jgi:hypothetical protein